MPAQVPVTAPGAVVNYQPIQYKVSPSAASALGAQLAYPQLPKNSLITELTLCQEGTNTTAAGTAAVQGVNAWVQSILLRCTYAKGGGDTYINSIPGWSMRRMALAKNNTQPRSVSTLTAGSAAYWRTVVPLVFRQNFLRGKLWSLTGIPGNLLNDLTLQVQLATQAQLDLAATPAYAVANLNNYVVVETYDLASLPQRLILLPGLFEQVSYNVTASGQTDLLVAAGDYIGNIVIEAYSGANSMQADGGAAPFAPFAAGGINLIDLNRNIKSQTDFQIIRDQNIELFAVDTLEAGVAILTYNRGLNQFWNVNNVMTAAQQINLQSQLVTATGAKVVLTIERVKGFQAMLDELSKQRQGNTKGLA